MKTEIVLIGILAFIGPALISGFIENKEDIIEIENSWGIKYENSGEQNIFQPEPTMPEEVKPQSVPEEVKPPPVPKEFKPKSVPEGLFEPPPMPEVFEHPPIVEEFEPPLPPPLYELFFEKAREDVRVQRIIGGKNYTVTGMRRVEEIDNVILMVEVEGKNYEVVFDLDTETVESVMWV